MTKKEREQVMSLRSAVEEVLAVYGEDVKVIWTKEPKKLRKALSELIDEHGYGTSRGVTKPATFTSRVANIEQWAWECRHDMEETESLEMLNYVDDLIDDCYNIRQTLIMEEAETE